MAAQVFGKIAVMPSLAVSGVTNDRMGNVLQMPPQLVPSAGNRYQLKQGVAAARIAVDGHWELNFSEPAKMCQGILGFCAAPLSDEFVRVALAAERVVYPALFGRVAAHHGAIGFANRTCLELAPQQTGHFLAQAKEQNPRGAPVKPVRRPDALPDLIA